MIDKYRRDGTPYPDTEAGLLEWAQDISDFSKKLVKQERVGRFWISTVWLGLDHSFGYGEPKIFESMVFDKRRRRGHKRIFKFFGKKHKDIGIEMAQERYSTLDDALAGHGELCRKFKKKK